MCNYADAQILATQSMLYESKSLQTEMNNTQSYRQSYKCLRFPVCIQLHI